MQIADAEIADVKILKPVRYAIRGIPSKVHPQLTLQVQGVNFRFVRRSLPAAKGTVARPAMLGRKATRRSTRVAVG